MPQAVTVVFGSANKMSALHMSQGDQKSDEDEEPDWKLITTPAHEGPRRAYVTSTSSTVSVYQSSSSSTVSLRLIRASSSSESTSACLFLKSVSKYCSSETSRVCCCANECVFAFGAIVGACETGSSTASNAEKERQTNKLVYAKT